MRQDKRSKVGEMLFPDLNRCSPDRITTPQVLKRPKFSRRSVFVRGKERRKWAKRKKGLCNSSLHSRGGRTPFIHDRQLIGRLEQGGVRKKIKHLGLDFFLTL
jgi:hypothetical protein